MVFVSFSYPLQYVAVWLFLAFYLLALLPPKEKNKKHPRLSIGRAIIVVGCALILSFVKQIQAEIKWKTIIINSLRGNTEKNVT